MIAAQAFYAQGGSQNLMVGETSPSLKLGSGGNAGFQVAAAIAYGGNRSSGPLDVATSCLANGSPHGRQDFASETFVACFHPTQDPISSTDGSAHAMGTGSKGGCSSHAVCVTGQAVAVRTANTGANGHGVADEVTHTIDQVQGQAIAFTAKDSGGDATNEVSPTMRAMHHIDGNANAGGQLAVAFTKAKRAQSNSDDESWVPGAVAPTQNQFDQGDTRATTVVAYNTWGGEPRADRPNGGFYVEQNAETSKTLDSQGGLNPAASQGGTVVAFANRTRDGIKVPEVMKDGVVPALTNPGNGGRADAVNVVAPGPVQVQWASGGGKVENPTMQSLRSSAEYSYQFIRNAMQVRRLCPSECEALQGFPIGYTDVHYRKKPAADGPRYRALGNSMAVPCMWWLGHRIHQATR